jgi:hypothetical protein
MKRQPMPKYMIDGEKAKSIIDLAFSKWPTATYNNKKCYTLCDYNLTSLEGCPNIVDESLYVGRNKLTTLSHGPNEVKGDFIASYNKLTSLVSGPQIVDGSYEVSRCKLTSLDGSPNIVNGTFDITYNANLTSLLGGPIDVGGAFIARRCDLLSLAGGPITVGGNYDITGNTNLLSLVHLPERIGGDLKLPYGDILATNGLRELKGLKEVGGCIYVGNFTSHILGVFFIKGCQGLLTYTSYGNEVKAAEIVNRYISKGRAGLFPCTQELIEAGLADFAQI